VVPNVPAAVSTEQGYANAFISVGAIKGPVNVAGTFSNQINSAIAADEAAYEKEYPSYFVVPAYAKSGEYNTSAGG
jgi:hypothetical protein